MRSVISFISMFEMLQTKCRKDYNKSFLSERDTLYSSVLDFFSNRSMSVLWLMMTLSFSLSLLR